jgi:hypothetical protein
MIPPLWPPLAQVDERHLFNDRPVRQAQRRFSLVGITTISVLE